MSDSVAAARKIEEFRALAEKWARENPIDIDGQQFFPNIESCLDFNATLKPTVEAYEKTPYRKEWVVIQKHMRTGFRKSTLFEFKGKENQPIPCKEIDADNPHELIHLINLDLLRVIHSSRLNNFNWRLDYDQNQKTFMLATTSTR